MFEQLLSHISLGEGINLIIAFINIVAVFIAVWTIRVNTENNTKAIIANTENTLKMASVQKAEKILSDPDHVEKYNKFVELKEKNAHLEQYLSVNSNNLTEEYNTIIYVLNNWESICAAINEQALQEGLMKKILYSRLTHDYKVLSIFITKIRTATKQDTLFQEFEIVAKTWIKNPLKIQKTI